MTEAQRYDAGIRVRRWHRRIDHLADGKRLINKALGHTRQRKCTEFLTEWKAPVATQVDAAMDLEPEPAGMAERMRSSSRKSHVLSREGARTIAVSEHSP